MEQPGFFDIEEQLARLSWLGYETEAFSRIVNLEVFSPNLQKPPAYSDGVKGEPPPFDPALMLKILFFRTLNNLSHERTKYLISDYLASSQTCRRDYCTVKRLIREVRLKGVIRGNRGPDRPAWSATILFTGSGAASVACTSP